MIKQWHWSIEGPYNLLERKSVLSLSVHRLSILISSSVRRDCKLSEILGAILTRCVGYTRVVRGTHSQKTVSMDIQFRDHKFLGRESPSSQGAHARGLFMPQKGTL